MLLQFHFNQIPNCEKCDTDLEAKVKACLGRRDLPHRGAERGGWICQGIYTEQTRFIANCTIGTRLRCSSLGVQCCLARRRWGAMCVEGDNWYLLLHCLKRDSYYWRTSYPNRLAISPGTGAATCQRLGVAHTGGGGQEGQRNRPPTRLILHDCI